MKTTCKKCGQVVYVLKYLGDLRSFPRPYHIPEHPTHAVIYDSAVGYGGTYTSTSSTTTWQTMRCELYFLTDEEVDQLKVIEEMAR